MGYLDLQPTPLPQFIHGAWSFDFSGVEVQRCPGLSGKYAATALVSLASPG